MREIIQPIRGHDEEKHHSVMVHKRATHFLYKEKTVMVQNILGKRDISKKGKREEIRVAVGPHAYYLRTKGRGFSVEAYCKEDKNEAKQNKRNTRGRLYIILLIDRYG